MYYSLQLKNIKQSAKNLGLYLKEKNLAAPQHVILDALAKTFFYKNWNTLEGMTNQPHIIEHIKLKNRYLIELQIRNCSQHELLSILKKVWHDCGYDIHIANLIEQNQNYHIEINIKPQQKSSHENKALRELNEETFENCMRVFEQHMAPWLISLEYCIIACTKRKLIEHTDLSQAPDTAVDNNNKELEPTLNHVERTLGELGYNAEQVAKLEKIQRNTMREKIGTVLIDTLVGSGMSHTLQDFIHEQKNRTHNVTKAQDILDIAQTGHMVYTTISVASLFDTIERITRAGGIGKKGTQQNKKQHLRQTLENLVIPEQFEKKILAKTLGSEMREVSHAANFISDYHSAQ